ncbi:MAG: hypothetical protein PUP91_24635 [Rhizonema sp. PD37]|nr:hypothetical protein [Rhizonema sp. PD37]
MLLAQFNARDRVSEEESPYPTVHMPIQTCTQPHGVGNKTLLINDLNFDQV